MLLKCGPCQSICQPGVAIDLAVRCIEDLMEQGCARFRFCGGAGEIRFFERGQPRNPTSKGDRVYAQRTYNSATQERRPVTGP
jgi:hypothetical protein